MQTAHKKVLVRMLDSTVLPGYLPPARLGAHTGSEPAVDLLDLDGRLQSLGLGEIKSVAYVREFHRGSPDPERLSRRSFLARPRQEGLWLRLTFVTGDRIEGLAAADRSFLDAAVEDSGVFFTPPDARSNTQRLFVPRLAVTSLELLAVIGAPGRRRTPAAATSPAAIQQERLFTETL
jgi:hypothetical protein